MTDYEIHYRVVSDDDDAPWTVLPRLSTTATSIRLTDLDEDEEYEIRVRTVDAFGEASDWKTYYHTVTPAAIEVPVVEGLAAVDGDCLSWTMPQNRERVEGFEIRTAPGDHRHWASAEPAHEGLIREPPFILCGVPGGTRTFMVRAIDVDGNAGEPAIIIAEPKPLDDAHDVANYAVDFQADGWTGTIVGGTIVAGEIRGALGLHNRLWPTGVGQAIPLWDPTPRALLWRGPMLWPRRTGGGARLWEPKPGGLLWGARYPTLTYTTSITVSVAKGATTARLTLDVEATPSGWRVEYRRQRDLLWPDPGQPGALLWDADPAAPLWTPNTTPWLPWPGRLERAVPGLYEFRVVMPGGITQAKLTGMSATVSVPELVEQITFFPIGGPLRLPLTKTFQVIHDVEVRVVSSADGAVQAWVHDLEPQGPLVSLVTAAWAPATGRANIRVRGY